MRRDQGYFTTRDGLKLFYRLYDREGNTDTLLILHGHGEHSGRYEKFASILEEQNLSLAMFDFRGTGLSEGPEVYVERYEHYLDDISRFVDFLGNQFSRSLRLIVLGHSLGGLTALHWAKSETDKVKALILSSPSLGLRLPRFVVGINHLLNSVAPKMTYRNPVYPPYLTHSMEEVERYRKDKLIRRKITVRLLDEMLRYMNLLDAEGTLQFDFPVYVLMAGTEKVVDAGRTKLIFDKIKAPDKQLKIFPELYHEIFNELGQEQVFDVLKQYLNRIREAGY